MKWEEREKVRWKCHFTFTFKYSTLSGCQRILVGLTIVFKTVVLLVCSVFYFLNLFEYACLSLVIACSSLFFHLFVRLHVRSICTPMANVNNQKECINQPPTTIITREFYYTKCILKPMKKCNILFAAQRKSFHKGWWCQNASKWNEFIFLPFLGSRHKCSTHIRMLCFCRSIFSVRMYCIWLVLHICGQWHVNLLKKSGTFSNGMAMEW